MEQWAEELHKPARRPRHFSRVFVSGVDDTWAMDLADMTKDWVEQNDGYRYILVAVDVFSRYAMCAPLKSKDATDTWNALEKLLVARKPQKIWVDKGSEFWNSTWREKLKEKQITLYTTQSGEYKASVAEAFNKTLKTRMWKMFTAQNTRKWIDKLDDLVKTYNTSRHSALDMTPTEAHDNKTLAVELWKKQYGNAIRPPTRPKYDVGEWVRISRLKGLFEKGFHPNWSYEIYKIKRIALNPPHRYYLADYQGEDIIGAFYEAELEPASDPSFFPIDKIIAPETRNGVEGAIVSFVGHPKKFNRWLPMTDLENLAEE